MKLRGRAKKITFHVFDPRRVEEILNEDLVSAWREEDAETKAENRRQAAWKARLKRAPNAAVEPGPVTSSDEVSQHQLKGWEEFERDGLLR